MPRVPQMGISAGGHRRTLSGVSTTSSNMNSGFRTNPDDIPAIYQFNLNINNISNHESRMRVYENVPYTPQHIVTSPYHHPQQIVEYHPQPERPATLSFESGAQTKLRSSLKRYGNCNIRSSSASGGGNSGGGTPTNPTPPDSLTSDDSSYLSAKDGSVSSQSRVRFSPETLLDLPSQGQCHDPTVPLTAQQTAGSGVGSNSGVIGRNRQSRRHQLLHNDQSSTS